MAYIILYAAPKAVFFDILNCLAFRREGVGQGESCTPSSLITAFTMCRVKICWLRITTVATSLLAVSLPRPNPTAQRDLMEKGLTKSKEGFFKLRPVYMRWHCPLYRLHSADDTTDFSH